MTAWYQEINVVQEPLDMGTDDNNRPKVGFNIETVKRPSDSFAEEIVGLLVAAGVGIAAGAGADIFVGTKHKVPDGDGPYLTMIETGGATPLRTHNDIGPPAYTRPTAQLVARAKKYTDARARARAAYDALVGIRNTTVAG